MAFSTELVLAAQTGPGIEYRTLPTLARTTTTSSWTTLASEPEVLGAGTWLLVYQAAINLTGTNSRWTVNLGGTLGGVTSTVEPSAANGLNSGTILQFAAVVDGSNARALAQAQYGRFNAGTLHVARIG